MRDTAAGAWVPLVWLAGACALARIDPVYDALPVLGLLRGRLGVALVVGAGLVVATRRFGWHARLPRPAPWALFSVSAIGFAASSLSWMGSVQATGDEPEYLLMAQSLWRDGDLELENNWRERQFEEYTAGMPRPPFGTYRADGRPFPARSPGLPFAIAPVYAIGGRAACLILLALVGAAFALEVRALAACAGAGEAASLLAWLAAVGPPAGFMAIQVYPALLAGLAVALSLRLLLSDPGPLAAAAAGLAAASLPWLHTRLIAAAVALGLIALWRLRGRSLLAFLAAVGVMAAGFAAYHHAVFGAPSPLGPYGGKLPRGIRRSTPLRALLGVWLDRSFGLLPYAPAFAIALAGLPRLVARGWREAAPFLLVGAGVLAPVVMWRAWFGGFSPPARFLVPLVPALVAPLALRLGGRRYGLARWAGPLLAAGVAWVVLLAAQPAQMRLLNVKHEAPYGFAWLSDPVSAGRYLPNFTSREPADERVCALWVVAALALFALDAVARRRERVDRLFASPGLPLCGLVAVGVLVDLWAR